MMARLAACYQLAISGPSWLYLSGLGVITGIRAFQTIVGMMSVFYLSGTREEPDVIRAFGLGDERANLVLLKDLSPTLSLVRGPFHHGRGAHLWGDWLPDIYA